MAEITNHVKYYLYVLSQHYIKYYMCVLCLHIMLGMIFMFYVSTERLPTNSGCSQHPCHPIEAVSRRVCFHFVHPPNSLPFFSPLLTSYCLYFSSLLHPVELSETSSGFLNYIQFPVSAASVKTVVSSEVCSLQSSSLSKNCCLFRGMFSSEVCSKC